MYVTMCSHSNVCYYGFTSNVCFINMLLGTHKTYITRTHKTYIM